MEKDHLVTIAIPAYKGKYLAETIQSAINQSYKNIEIVIVNDKSPEDLRSVVGSIDDPRIRYFENEENLGRNNPVANWNKCLSYARGDYFCLLCDDDLYKENFVEDLISLSMKYPDVDVFRSAMVIVDAQNNPTDFYPSSPEYETMEEYMFHVAKEVRSQTVSEWMIRTSRMRECGGYTSLPLAWGSDYVSVYKFSQDRGIVSTNRRNVLFRQSGINISSRKGSTILPKIEALNKKLIMINELLDSSDCEYKELIRSNYAIRLERFKKDILTKSDVKTLAKVLFHLTGYRITFPIFMSALAYKIKRIAR